MPNQKFTADTLPSEGKILRDLVILADLNERARAKISKDATKLVEKIRSASRPGLMESFLAEYGLSTEEGVALMCLAEALLRVPDSETIDALIEDKIAASDWRKHLGHSTSSLVNASTWGLMLTGKVLADNDTALVGTLKGVVKRLGEPVIRTAVGSAMREMGKQFVLGETIESALKNAQEYEENGFTYSYDMLGEAARTEADAKRYHLSYSAAITAMASACTHEDIRENPGISVKLSALHPRYEFGQSDRVLVELTSRVKALALLAKDAGMGFNIDAEEADRLTLSLEVIEAVLSDPALKGWDGFGVVVQAYGLRAKPVLDWLYALAKRLDRKIMVRLVKGAYWDTEIKRAQVLGLNGFPVFTRKAATDVSYIANARKLLNMRDRIYPQFATHNAHTVAAVLNMAKDTEGYEFQRLHGMGENLHDAVMEGSETRCRIYAPVGAHRDLLAYLVRRLLENGANSSFVNQIVDEDVPASEVAQDPFNQIDLENPHNPTIACPPELFGDTRRNARGWDITDSGDRAKIDIARDVYRHREFHAGPIIAGDIVGGPTSAVTNPFNPDDTLGTIRAASPEDVETALDKASIWQADGKTRRKVLLKAADLFEANAGVFFALAAREAGKTLPDAISELREAVDFLRFYANEAPTLTQPPRGVIACISPWNFPLAIFTGQIAGALTAGNAVIAKPAEQTPLIAVKALDLLLQAGVPATALQLLPGEGAVVGTALTSDPRINGVCFTGSTATAQHINRSMAAHLSPDAMLIAETGGINAMIVDSTALHEQAVGDILISAFQSAGQRCSALRVLYVQSDIADELCKMLFGAMEELRAGDPWLLETDTGPVIDMTAASHFREYIRRAKNDGRLLKQLPETGGQYIPPTAIRVDSIKDMKVEIFGPVLHIATFEADEIEKVVADINASGFGLTFGVHSRIDDRVQNIIDKLHVGNIYVNRNQVGAVVGSQPFGGEGLSGTGPKAGGPYYVQRMTESARETMDIIEKRSGNVDQIQAGLDALPTPPSEPLEAFDLAGPTGESNRLTIVPRGKVLCLGPGDAEAKNQTELAEAQGCSALAVGDGIDPAALGELSGFDAVVYWGEDARPYRMALAARNGAILPLIIDNDPTRFHLERHVCIDTTASGGNAELLAATEEGSADIEQ